MEFLAFMKSTLLISLVDMVNPAALISAVVIFTSPLSPVIPPTLYSVNTSNGPGVFYWEMPAMSESTNDLNILNFVKI